MTKPFRAVIVDDEPLAIEGLEQLCQRSNLAQIVGTAADGASGLSLVLTEQPDAVFLDIGMPGLSGLAVAHRLRALAHPPLVVFVTAYDHFATEAFDLAVVDYVLKPVEAERLARAIDRTSTLFASRQDDQAAAVGADDLWAPSRGGMTRVPISAIKRVDAEGDYVRLSVEAASYLLRLSMSALEARLDHGRFIRIHRSTIVRLDCITELRHIGSGVWAVLDTTGRLSGIGRSYLPKVRLQLSVPTFEGTQASLHNNKQDVP